MFKNDVLEGLEIELSDQQLKMFDLYYEQLIAYNEHTNLTRITERNEVNIKHFYDSLTLAKTLDLTAVRSLCDMGAGAGFPSIPLKFIYPHLNITIIDSLGKRIVFLKQLIETLDLRDVNLVYDRIEKHAENHQEVFDVVVARALGSLPLILEMGIPMLKTKGKLVAYKGHNYESELLDSKKTLLKLGSKLIEEERYDLPNDMGHRVHLVVEKMKHVHGYPRSFAIMKKKPL